MILDIIADATKKRVLASQKALPLAEIKAQAQAMPGTEFRFEKALAGEKLSFICEIKKASPSKGVIAEDFPYLEIAASYQAAGATAISVLTEPEFFQGRDSYLTEISSQVKIPLLRKDFIIDEYQLYQSKIIGADAVLLICALLNTQILRRYIQICDSLGLSALVEAHNPHEVESALKAGARIIGVNNRNLKNFEVDLENSLKLRPLVPKEVLFIAESGIKTPQDIKTLSQANVNGVLIGEALMKSKDKGLMLKTLRGE